jgi:hypothetical protein
MFSFFKNLIKKGEKESQTVGSDLSIDLPSAIEIESIANNQSGGGKKYYDNIYSRNVSKL